jgi:hypothetical protein
MAKKNFLGRDGNAFVMMPTKVTGVCQYGRQVKGDDIIRLVRDKPPSVQKDMRLLLWSLSLCLGSDGGSLNSCVIRR